ncbi:DUF2158 domain-containing protein [Sulfurovum sp. zt1-1]|uniref:DUF2158 domain-containing protein n=1 Tax=Sulfurovum zhangzhouensis TaxID=3019067 RepID=A0ABT7QXQ0_9BACT|nr:DUF2158 domain-containing protein [Sulfurovum zhangzhouensis]MDM5271602.1 DUF2158 domain-containing protein [Sulfurovum zhangzhouensis]
MFIGDTVQLNSGGPLMTIEAVYESEVTCIWFDNNSVVRHNFNEVLLVKI